MKLGTTPFACQQWACAILAVACTAHSTPQLPTTPPPVVESVTAPRRVIPATNITLLAGLLPAMPEAVTSFGAASDGHYLYTLGGYSGEPHAYAMEGQSARFSRLAIDGASPWEALPEMPHGLQGLAVARYGQKICRIGGTEARNHRGTAADMHSVSEVACFDIASQQWTEMTPLPAGRSSHDAAVVGNVLYVVGGWRLAGAASTGTFYEDMLALDLSVLPAAPGGQWKSIPVPFKRRALGVAEADGKLVIVGGITPEGQPSTRVDIFDPRTGSFTQGPEFPDNAFGVAVESVDGAVVASAESGVVYRFRPGERGWKAVASLAFGRFFHQLVATSGSELAALGGISGMHNRGRTRHVERVDLSNPQARVVAWSMPYPGAAKNRQGLLVQGDYVYLFGGNNSLEQHDFEPHNFVSETWRLHVPSMELAQVADFPVARQTMQTASLEESGLALGGFGHDGTKAVSFADGYAFDFETERWSPSMRLPESRTQFGLAEHGNTLWIFGGLNYDPTRQGPDAFQHVTSVLRATPGKDTVFADARVALPAERRAFAAAVYGDSYYLLGGMRGGFDLVDDCLRYDFTPQTFTAIACPGAARLSGALVPMHEHLYLVGGSVKGEGALKTANDVIEFDPKTGEHRSVVAQLPFDTKHAHAFAFHDRIVVLSTHNAEQRINVALLLASPQ